MSMRTLIGLSLVLPVLAVVAIGPASAERYCYPYPDGGPGGYNRLTHACNPLNMHMLPVHHMTGEKIIQPTGGTHGTANKTSSHKVGPATPK